MIKKAFLSVSISLLILASGFAESSSSVANKRTAVRYLQIAEQYAHEKSWREVESNVELGLAYDDSIPDLWYLKALAESAKNSPKGAVIPLVEKSLELGKWNGANRDSARLLYADLLSDTLRFDEALKVLDERPLIYTADAEYIRAKSYYGQHTAESLKNARSKVNVARKIYPEDSRFALLFFAHEYKINDSTEEVQALAQKFIRATELYKDPSPELELYSVIFSEGEEKERKLKKFAAEEKKAPLFAQLALENGLLDEFKAIDAFYEFSDSEIELSVVENFVSLVKDETAKKELFDYFNSYNGIIKIDSDGDLVPNISIKYKRGRAEAMTFDRNQDGFFEWTCECDFGSPLNVHIAKDSLDLTYVDWPEVQKAVYHLDNETSDLVFNLVAENIAYSPFAIDYDEVLKNTIDVDFFIPILIEDENLETSMLIAAASSYEMPSKERDHAVVKVILLDGTIQTAKYFVGERMYAFAQFENGIPMSRYVDKDNDGFFETTEVYGFTSDKTQKFLSPDDEIQIVENLFGRAAKTDGLYIKKILIDTNCDTVPEFIEEYVANLGKITSWDVNSDGEWDVQYVKYPEEKGKRLREEAKFHQPLSDEIVTVYSEDGKPLYVTSGSRRLFVEKGLSENFYWIASLGADSDEEIILKNINQVASQGVSIIIQSENDRFLAVRVGSHIFAEKLPPSEIPEENK